MLCKNIGINDKFWRKVALLRYTERLKGQLRFGKKIIFLYLNSKSVVRNGQKIQKKHFYHISSL